MKPEFNALVAPNAVKNLSLNQVHSILAPQLVVLGLTPGMLLCIATGQMANNGSGPGGAYTEADLDGFIASGGITADDPIYIQMQIPNAPNGTQDQVYDCGDMLRVLEGYPGDTATAPDPTSTYVARVQKLYTENFRNAMEPNNPTAPLLAGQGAMLNIPSVGAAVASAMTAVLPAPAPTKTN